MLGLVLAGLLGRAFDLISAPSERIIIVAAAAALTNKARHLLQQSMWKGREGDAGSFASQMPKEH